jgi:threonine dehydrogenase-like Zn-dependent dehydrogenase
MWAYILRRVLATIPVMAVVALFVFSLLYLAPGDPAAVIAGDQASPDDVERIRASLGLAGRRGTVSVVGVNQDRSFDFPMSKAFGMGLTFRIGTCSVPQEWPELIPLVQSGRIKPERYISHTLPLSDGKHAYDIFDRRVDGAMKMVFDMGL